MRELAVLRLYIPDGDVNGYFVNGNTNIPCRTHWSFGLAGEFYDSGRGIRNRYGWGAHTGKIFMMETTHSVSTTRCVKDIKR